MQSIFLSYTYIREKNVPRRTAPKVLPREGSAGGTGSVELALDEGLSMT